MAFVSSEVLVFGLSTGDVGLLHWKLGETVFQSIGRVPGSVTGIVGRQGVNGCLIAASSDIGTSHVWTKEGREVATRGIPLNPLDISQIPKDLQTSTSVHSFALSPAKTELAIACGSAIRMFDLRTGSEIWSRFDKESTREFVATNLVFEKDGNSLLVADGIHRRLCLLDTKRGGLIRKWGDSSLDNRVMPSEWSSFRMESILAYRGEVSNDGNFITSMGGMTTPVTWNRQTGERLASASVVKPFPHTQGYDNAYFVTSRGDLTVEISQSVGSSKYAGIPRIASKSDTNIVASTSKVPIVSGEWPPPGIDGRNYLYHREKGHVGPATCAFLSQDRRFVFTGGKDNRVIMWDLANRIPVRSFLGHSGIVRQIDFIPGKDILITGSHDGTIRLWNVSTGVELGCLTVFADKTWAFNDLDGRYDGSNGGDINGLHWAIGTETILLKQLKERYYEPGLLAKKLGLNPEPLRNVKAFRDLKLFPDAVIEIVQATKQLKIDLTNRGGGIGRVQVLINGKELLADARGPKPEVEAKSASLRLDLSDARLLPGKSNRVEVVTWNAEGYLSSRGLVREIKGPVATAEAPQLYAVVAGVSQYENNALNLRFAAKDAVDFASALELGSKRLFGTEKTHLSLLATSDDPRALMPTKENFQKVFGDLQKARPGDILVVYLSGHGMALQQGNDLYCYLTANARSLDPQSLNDPAVRSANTVSSEELAEWTKRIPALKQVMILDTCAAGAAAMKLTEKRNVTGDQIRAIERMKDRTGFHVLMGCSADRVSYEASQYGQGLLTYSLLQGMRGASLRDDQFVDVSKLFQYAADQVPDLALNVGGVQRPIVAAPRGTSFDIGRLDSNDRAQVPLSIVKPLILKPNLLNRDEDEDDLRLTTLLSQSLVESSQPSVRGKHSPIVYVPEDDFPGAIRPTGTYSVEGNKIAVRIALKRDGNILTRLQIEGKKSDLVALARKMADEILSAIK